MLTELRNLGLLNLLTGLYLPACYQHRIVVGFPEEPRGKVVLTPFSPEKFSTSENQPKSLDWNKNRGGIKQLGFHDFVFL